MIIKSYNTKNNKVHHNNMAQYTLQHITSKNIEPYNTLHNHTSNNKVHHTNMVAA
jgi:methyltransferase-like protein